MGNLSNIEKEVTKTKIFICPSGISDVSHLISFQRCVTCVLNRHNTTCKRAVPSLLLYGGSFISWMEQNTDHYLSFSFSKCFFDFPWSAHLGWSPSRCSLSALVGSSPTVYFYLTPVHCSKALASPNTDIRPAPKRYNIVVLVLIICQLYISSIDWMTVTVIWQIIYVFVFFYISLKSKSRTNIFSNIWCLTASMIFMLQSEGL